MPIILVPVGLVVYCLAVVLIFVFWCWFFDNPQEWDWFIPIVTSSFSLAIVCSFIEDKFKSYLSNVIISGLVAAFWICFVVVDVYGTVESFITGDFSMDNVDVLMFYLDKLLSSKIFAVMSVIMFFGNLGEYKKNQNTIQ